MSPQAVRIFLYDEWVTSVPTHIIVEELEKSGVIRHESRSWKDISVPTVLTAEDHTGERDELCEGCEATIGSSPHTVGECLATMKRDMVAAIDRACDLEGRHESRRPVASLGPYLYDGTWRHLDGDALGLENAIDDTLEGKAGRYRVTVEEDSERVESRGKVVAERVFEPAVARDGYVSASDHFTSQAIIALEDGDGRPYDVRDGKRYTPIIQLIELPEGSDG